MNRSQLKDLLLQSLEHERGGVEVYTTALENVVNDDCGRSGRTISSRRGDTCRSWNAFAGSSKSTRSR